MDKTGKTYVEAAKVLARRLAFHADGRQVSIGSALIAADGKSVTVRGYYFEKKPHHSTPLSTFNLTEEAEPSPLLTDGSLPRYVLDPVRNALFRELKKEQAKLAKGKA